MAIAGGALGVAAGAAFCTGVIGPPAAGACGIGAVATGSFSALAALAPSSIAASQGNSMAAADLLVTVVTRSARA
jgi:hypothetical protein